jgi:Bacterial pre-peptidase C-terminal domain
MNSYQSGCKNSRIVTPKNVLATAIASIAILGAATANAGVIRDIALANSTDTHQVWYNADDSVRITLRGDSDTDLDLFVQSPSGRTLCRRVGPSDRETCSFRAPETGDYRIEVRNLGTVANIYRVFHNG